MIQGILKFKWQPLIALAISLVLLNCAGTATAEDLAQLGRQKQATEAAESRVIALQSQRDAMLQEIKAEESKQEALRLRLESMNKETQP